VLVVGQHLQDPTPNRIAENVECLHVSHDRTADLYKSSVKFQAQSTVTGSPPRKVRRVGAIETLDVWLRRPVTARACAPMIEGLISSAADGSASTLTISRYENDNRPLLRARNRHWSARDIDRLASVGLMSSCDVR
jgi:hypothetical protein